MSEPNPAADDHQRSVAQITELTGGLAHELRNPLSTMMINLKLLSEHLQDNTIPPQDMRRRALVKLEVVRREAERLEALFNDFLHLAGPRRLTRVPADLAAIVDKLITFLKPVLEAGDVEVKTICPRRPVACEVDEKLLAQSLLNIALNAQQAMPEGGTLTFSVRSEGDWGVISVSDTGLGITPEDRERIFRPFFSTKSTGTGLGLSITKRIVSDHGGRLVVESTPGKGTTFTVRLPVSAPEGDDRDPG